MHTGAGGRAAIKGGCQHKLGMSDIMFGKASFLVAGPALRGELAGPGPARSFKRRWPAAADAPCPAGGRLLKNTGPWQPKCWGSTSRYPSLPLLGPLVRNKCGRPAPVDACPKSGVPNQPWRCVSEIHFPGGRTRLGQARQGLRPIRLRAHAEAVPKLLCGSHPAGAKGPEGRGSGLPRGVGGGCEATRLRARSPTRAPRRTLSRQHSTLNVIVARQSAGVLFSYWYICVEALAAPKVWARSPPAGCM